MTTDNEIAALLETWIAALEAGDPERIADLYAKDSIFLPTKSNKIRRNHNEVAEYFTGFLSKSPTAKADTQNIRMLGDIAVNSGTYTFTMTADGETSDLPCRYTFVYRKDGEEWKIIEHHSSVMPDS